MKRFPQSPKKPNLSESIGRHLDMYALAASAAGVGVMALAQPAEGKIVFTPANVPIVGTVNIDLNHDGVADFAIKVNVYAGAYVAAHSLGQNRVWGAGKSASALLAGVRVRPNPVKFQKGPVCSFLSVTSGPCKDMLTCRNFSGSTQCKGPFAATTTANESLVITTQCAPLRGSYVSQTSAQTTGFQRANVYGTCLPGYTALSGGVYMSKPDGSEASGSVDYSEAASGNRWYASGTSFASSTEVDKLVALEQCIQ